jgi:hypothetical protein
MVSHGEEEGRKTCGADEMILQDVGFGVGILHSSRRWSDQVLYIPAVLF